MGQLFFESSFMFVGRNESSVNCMDIRGIFI
jgi:hypothetical protein